MKKRRSDPVFFSQGRVDEPITFLGIDSDAGQPAKPTTLRRQLDPDG